MGTVYKVGLVKVNRLFAVLDAIYIYVQHTTTKMMMGNAVADNCWYVIMSPKLEIENHLFSIVHCTYNILLYLCILECSLRMQSRLYRTLMSTSAYIHVMW